MPRARKSSVAGLSPTSKNVAALFMRREDKLNDEQKAYLQRLCEADGALADARRLTQEFNGMVRNLEGEKLDGWLAEAEACGARGAPFEAWFVSALLQPCVARFRESVWFSPPRDHDSSGVGE